MKDSEKKLTTTFTLRTTEQMKADCEKLAKSHSKSLGGYVRDLMQMDLEKSAKLLGG